MRLAFAGTPEFAVPALEALNKAGHTLLAVYSQPDRPAGRGRRLEAPPVVQRARALGIPVQQPARLDATALAGLRALQPDALVVVAYGQILPPEALAVPRLGCLNIHASLLPRWRGAAPIQRAVLAGDLETGITIMRMDAGLDTGPLLVQERVAIGETMTAGELQAVLAPLGARLMVETLARLAGGTLRETPQPVEGASYAKKLGKDEAQLDWRRPAAELARAVRGYHPAPVAWTELDGERVRIHAASPGPAPAGAAPGTIVATDAGGIRVATGDRTLAITRLQWPGGQVLDAGAAAAGRALVAKRFTGPDSARSGA